MLSIRAATASRKRPLAGPWRWTTLTNSLIWESPILATISLIWEERNQASSSVSELLLTRWLARTEMEPRLMTSLVSEAAGSDWSVTRLVLAGPREMQSSLAQTWGAARSTRTST